MRHIPSLAASGGRLAALLSVLLAVGVTGAQAAPGDWTQERADAQQSSSNPHETILTPATVGGLVLAWQADDGGVIGSVEVAGNSVYTSWQSGAIVARKLAGDLRWVTLAPHGCGGVDGVLRGRLFIVPCGPTIMAVSTRDGHTVWSYAHPNNAALSLTLARGVLYIPWRTNGGGGAIDAVDAASGALLWRTALAAAPSTTAAVGGGRLVYCGRDRLMHGLDLRTHALVWTAPGCLGVTLAAGAAFVRDGQGYRLSDGALQLDIPTFSDFQPALVENTLYFANTCLCPPMVEGLVAYDATTGALLWSAGLQVGEEARAGPSTAGGLVWLVSELGDLQAYDGTNGDLLASVSTDPPDGFFDFSPPPVVSHGWVFTRGNGLRAFHLRG